MGKNGYSELGRYIDTLCKVNGLSWRKASIKAGLDSSVISKILQRDGESIPRAETLSKIAATLGGDFLHMMRLAGHLPSVEDESLDELDIELRAKMQRLQDLIHQAARQDPQMASRLMGLIITPVEIMLALDESDELRRESEEELEAAANGKKVL